MSDRDRELTATEWKHRNDSMAFERMRGATIRELARRFKLSKSQAQRVVAHVEILPPAPVFLCQLVPVPGGGYRAVQTVAWPRPRAYRVRSHRRVYAFGHATAGHGA